MIRILNLILPVAVSTALDLHKNYTACVCRSFGSSPEKDYTNKNNNKRNNKILPPALPDALNKTRNNEDANALFDSVAGCHKYVLNCLAFRVKGAAPSFITECPLHREIRRRS